MRLAIPAIDREEQKARIRCKREERDGVIAGVREGSYVDIIERCMEPGLGGFLYWCDNFCYTFDPREVQEPVTPFILYDFQERMAGKVLEVLASGGVLHLDKSRDMGATWVMMAILVHSWLFSEVFHAHLGSRVEDLVDDGTVDALMGKMDFIIRRLPDFMLQGYNEKSYRRNMKLKHPMGNLITGESANKNFGHGPRKNLVYLDEFAFWEHDRAVWRGIADVAPCRIVTSTPCGDGNMFAQLKENDKIDHITLHWTLHPYKDDAWYQEQCDIRSDPVAIAQELDINYKASAGRVALTKLRTHRGSIICPDIAPSDGENVGAKFFMCVDWGSTNPGAVLVPRVRRVTEILYEIKIVWEWYGPMTLPVLAEAIKTCPWWPMSECIYADPSMWFRNQAQKQGGVTSLANLLKEFYGIYLLPGIRGDTQALERINILTEDPDRVLFLICEGCENTFREFEGLHYETYSDKLLNRKNLPERLVDKNNHTWDAFKYFFNSYFVKPELAPEENDTPLLGYAGLLEDFKGLRKKKIEVLKPKKDARGILRLHTNNRRVFR